MKRYFLIDLWKFGSEGKNGVFEVNFVSDNIYDYEQVATDSAVWLVEFDTDLEEIKPLKRFLFINKEKTNDLNERIPNCNSVYYMYYCNWCFTKLYPDDVCVGYDEYSKNYEQAHTLREVENPKAKNPTISRAYFDGRYFDYGDSEKGLRNLIKAYLKSKNEGAFATPQSQPGDDSN